MNATPARPEPSTLTTKDVTYSNRRRGGYYADISDDCPLIIVWETAAHQRTTGYFRWTATAYTGASKKVAYGRSRIEAVRTLVDVINWHAYRDEIRANRA